MCVLTLNTLLLWITPPPPTYKNLRNIARATITHYTGWLKINLHFS